MSCKHDWLVKPSYGKKHCSKCGKTEKLPRCPTCGSLNIIKTGVYTTSFRKCLACGEEWQRQF